jgi:hypothetical protein
VNTHEADKRLHRHPADAEDRLRVAHADLAYGQRDDDLAVGPELSEAQPAEESRPRGDDRPMQEEPVGLLVGADAVRRLSSLDALDCHVPTISETWHESLMRRIPACCVIRQNSRRRRT